MLLTGSCPISESLLFGEISRKKDEVLSSIMETKGVIFVVFSVLGS